MVGISLVFSTKKGWGFSFLGGEGREGGWEIGVGVVGGVFLWRRNGCPRWGGYFDVRDGKVGRWAGGWVRS